MNPCRQQRGYSLIEMVVVILILGVLTAVTMRSLRGANDAVRVEETRAELDRLAWAVAGNPELTSGGRRTDYGYVGDVGALPADLVALVTNPGLGTWRGPYVRDEFYAAGGGAEISYSLDAWGKPYTLAGVDISSSGGGSSLTRRIANDADALLRNTVTVVVTDLAAMPPGAVYADSVELLLTIPNGLGSTTTMQANPRPNGTAEFDSIPIGSHLLALVYGPMADTLRRQVTVDPGQHVHLDLQYPAEVW